MEERLFTLNEIPKTEFNFFFVIATLYAEKISKSGGYHGTQYIFYLMPTL